MDRQVVESLMILILKVDSAYTFKEFWPISLCNMTYVLVSKVLVNHLRLILSEIVRPQWCNFIPSRGITDNAIILQKFIYHMSVSKTKQDDVIYKFDLEKD